MLSGYELVAAWISAQLRLPTFAVVQRALKGKNGVQSAMPADFAEEQVEVKSVYLLGWTERRDEKSLP